MPLTRDGLSALIRSADSLELWGVAADAYEAAGDSDQTSADVFLFDLQPSAIASLSALQWFLSEVPRARVVVLDDYVHGSNLHKAAEGGAAGYATRHHNFSVVAELLRDAATGKKPFSSPIPLGTPTSSNPSAERALLDSLTPRELEVLRYLAMGFTVKQCAAVLGRSNSTVDNHKSRMMKKLGVHKTVELTRIAIRGGLTDG